MKKCIISAITGALIMLGIITAAARIPMSRDQNTKMYEHIAYISAITPEECYVCGNDGKFPGRLYWDKDNIGIVNLNTFEVLYLEINRYDDYGNLVEEPAGFMYCDSISNEETQSHVYALCYPDNAYAKVQFFGVQYAIDRDSVQNGLCQTCLDTINGLWFAGKPPAEYAVISFEDQTIRPILNCYPWFAAGNYGVDCEFKEDGKIDLLIHYLPNRYTEQEAS